MKEFALTLIDPFTKGLKPDPRLARLGKVQYLSESKLMKPLPFGLREADQVESPFAIAPDVTWPFPQMIQEHDGVILAGSVTLATVNTTTLPWTIGADITTYDFYDPDNPLAIVAGEAWHYTRGLNSAVMTNGHCVVVRWNREGMLGYAPVTYVIAKHVSSLCHSRGRLIYGGFSPTDFWTDDWKAVIEEWLLKSPLSVDYPSQENIKEQFVFWSSIGDHALWPFEAPTSDWLEIFKRNEAGFMPMPWRGCVLDVLPLGDGVVVYGDNGIAFLKPVTQPYPTFGLVLLSDQGILERGASGGNETQHVFIGADGFLYSLTPNLEIRRIGSSDDFGSLFDPIISFDPGDREFHICGMKVLTPQCYIYTTQGVGQANKVPTSIVIEGGNKYSVYDSSLITAASIVTDIIDFGFRDLKTITTIEVGAGIKAGATLEMAVDYKYSNSDTWWRSSYIPVNSRGFGRVQVTANEFRIVLRCSTAEDFELDYINVRWQPVGRQSIRGVTGATEAYA